MTKTGKFLIYTIVVVVHAILVFCILSAGKSGENVEEDGVGGQEQSQPQTEAKNSFDSWRELFKKTGEAGGQGGEQREEKPAPRGASNVQTTSVSSPGYATGYFKNAPKEMGKMLAAKTGAVRAGLVIDQDTKQILWSKAADTAYPIASITKLMTAFLLVEQVRAGKATMSDKITITADDVAAVKKWGHGCYLAKDEIYTLEEMLKAMIIKSANDCAYVAGRYLAGTNEAFIARMNKRAKELKLNNFTFLNCNGYPITTNNSRQENMGSAMEVAYLADIVSGIPEIMKWAGTRKDCLREDANRFDLVTTNNLIRDKVPGVTGLKTGYTDTAGYCIVVTCERNGRHVMVVLLGMPAPARNRDDLAKALLNWAYE